MVDLIMGCLFGRLNVFFCIPLGCGLWDACGEKNVQPKKHFTSHDTFSILQGERAQQQHWDCRPPSCRRKTTLPSNFSASTSLTMPPLTVFHTGTAHKTVFPFPHKEFCWFMCYSGTSPSPPPFLLHTPNLHPQIDIADLRGTSCWHGGGISPAVFYLHLYRMRVQ